MSAGLVWLENMDDDFVPSESVGAAKVESLTDGEYDMEIKRAELKTLEHKNMAILEMHLEVLTPGKHQGMIVQHGLFLKAGDKEGRNRVGKDLMTLGIDCDQWTVANGRPFSQEIQKVAKVLRGLRLRTKKAVNGKYHNLYINKRIGGDGKPDRIGPEQLNAIDPLADDPFS